MSSLEELLTEVNYDYLDNNYVPSAEALEFLMFIKLVNGSIGTENKSPAFHAKVMTTVFAESDVLAIVHRGGAKSTLMQYFLLYLAVKGSCKGLGKIELAMYVSDTMENGVKTARTNLEFMWNNSEFLRKCLPKTRFIEDEWTFTNAQGHTLICLGFGINTGIRGTLRQGRRPKICIFDDLMSDKVASSPTLLENLETTIYNAVEYALHPTKRKIIWIGTPFNKRDPLYKAAGSNAWTTLVFPICERFPCTEKDFRGSWEDRFDYKTIRKSYEKLKELGKVDGFNQEMMLRILSDDDRLILESDIGWYSRKELVEKKQEYHWYITTDFATSEKEKADFSVISVWAYDKDGAWYWVDGIVERQTMDKTVNDLFRLVQKYNPLSTAIEITGQQKGFVSWIRKEMIDRKVHFHLASDKTTGEEGIRPNTSKLSRFNIVVPIFKQKKIKFPEDLKESKIVVEALDEILSVTPSGFKSVHDDFCDTISQLPLLDAVKGPGKTIKQEEKRTFSENKYFGDYSAGNEQEVSSYIV